MPKMSTDLDYELFTLCNFPIAQFVVLEALAGDDQSVKAEVLSRVQPEYMMFVERFLFTEIALMIRAREPLDVEKLRQRLVEFASDGGSPDFVQGCLANLDQALTLRPTPDHVEKALQIIEYNRARRKAASLVEALLALLASWRGERVSGFEQWLSELGWSEHDIMDVSRYLRDKGEGVVRYWLRLHQLEEDRAPGVIELLRTMDAFQ